jgi:predicted secreted protein
VNLANYTYYQYSVTPAAGVTTSATGTFQAAITVPSVFNGTHSVTAIDTEGNTATALLTVTGSAVKPPTGWSKTYGWPIGTEMPDGNMFQTSDGGYIVSGRTSSIGAGNYDAWLVKVDASGKVEWNKTYGGPLDDRVQDMCMTSDGGYALCCLANSFGAGSADFWLIKVTATGDAQWNKTYGGTGSETPYYIAQTSDGGYTMVGNTNSSGAGNTDFWLVKTDAGGNMQWNKTYGGTGADNGFHIIKTSDGGFALLGVTASSGAGGSDVWLIKADATGTMQWNKTYGGSSYDGGMAFVQTADGGYTVAALTMSFGAGGMDGWLFRTDAAGNMQWNRTYGGPATDYALHMFQTTADGGYIISGYTASFGAGGQDAWLIKTDASGNMLWSRTYGGVNADVAWSLAQTSDGGYIVAAMTESLGFGAVGVADMLLVKTDAVGVAPALPAASAFCNVGVLPGWTWYFFVHSNGGMAPYTYQWYEGTTPIAGQTSMVLPVTKTTAGAYTFYCRVTDAQGMTVTSNAVTLTVLG